MCTIAGCRRYQRECGACAQDRCLSGARTKDHLGIRPLARYSRLCFDLGPPDRKDSTVAGLLALGLYGIAEGAYRRITPPRVPVMQ